MIELQQEGSRLYIVGETYALRERIKTMGGHWDGERRAWWIGTTKREQAEALLASPAPATGNDGDKVSDKTAILGRASYKGKSGYLILWMGTTKRGEAAKLAFRDGSKIFWADRNEITVEKVYQEREYRGRSEPMTFGKLQRLAATYANARKEGLEPCEKCGSIHREGGCYMCGCTKCDGAHGGLCEED